MKSVVIRGEGDLFPQLLNVAGIDLDHMQSADVAGQRILSAYVTDQAIADIQALGLTVEVVATEADERAQLAQAFEAGGDEATRIDIA